MAPPRDDENDYEYRVATAVAFYHQALEAGHRVDPREWLDRYPELADDLAEYFEAEKQFDHLAWPLRLAASGGPDPTSSPNGSHDFREWDASQGLERVMPSR